MDLEAIRQNEIYKFMIQKKINPGKVNFTKFNDQIYKVEGEITEEEKKMINKIIHNNNEIYQTLKLIAQYKHGSMNKMKKITGNSSFPSLIKRCFPFSSTSVKRTTKSVSAPVVFTFSSILMLPAILRASAKDLEVKTLASCLSITED